MRYKPGAFPFYHMDKIPWEPLDAGIRRKVVSLDRLMLVLYHLPAGLVTDRDHRHPHEQAAYVFSGRVRVTVRDQSEELGPGSGYLVPPMVKHFLEALEDSVVLDCFSPPREDFLEQDGQ